MSIYFLNRLVGYFILENTPLIRLLTSVIRLSFFIPWAILRCNPRTEKYVQKVAFLYVIFWCMWPNLSFRDQVPEIMIEPDRRADEETILVTLLIFHTMNYNRFLTTVILIPLIIFPAYYSQTVQMMTMWSDPYTDETLDSELKKEEFQQHQMITMFLLVFQILTHQYLIQRDLIMAVIQKHIVSEGQTLLYEYLMKNNDAMIVASVEDGKTKVELCNTAATDKLSETNDTAFSVAQPIFKIQKYDGVESEPESDDLLEE